VGGVAHGPAATAFVTGALAFSSGLAAHGDESPGVAFAKMCEEILCKEHVEEVDLVMMTLQTLQEMETR
jgi:hypothetical protein